jgi:hypothetical protein
MSFKATMDKMVKAIKMIKRSTLERKRMMKKMETNPKCKGIS